MAQEQVQFFPLNQAWEVPTALFVEAEQQLYAQLEKKTGNHPGWSSIQAVVASTLGEVPFYLKNNPQEHGLIEAEALTTLWRNIKTVTTQTVQTETLASILGSETIRTSTPLYNWIVIECLPATEILAGAGEYLGQMDVVVVRVILAEDTTSQTATQVAVDKLLASHGFQCVNSIEENHPAIGQVLYVRDHKTSVRNQRQSLIALQQHNQQLALEKDNAEQDNNACRQQIDALQLHNQQLALEKDNAEQDNNACRQQIDALQQHNQQLALEKDNAEHANSNYLPQLDSLQQQLAEIQQSKQQLETSHAEMVREYNLLQDEFVKAEAQVELIRELLRRELNESSEHIIHEA